MTSEAATIRLAQWREDDAREARQAAESPYIISQVAQILIDHCPIEGGTNCACGDWPLIPGQQQATHAAIMLHTAGLLKEAP
jgi:hypothetical protein